MEKEEYYHQAFSRNLGLIAPHEQSLLRDSRVAIAGVGGVGGIHLVTLARIGVGNFSIADPDIFEIANVNRQYGASTATLNRNKAEVLGDLLRDINPHAQCRVFTEGITAENLDDFLSGSQVFLDGIDFFSLDVRRRLFQRAREMKIPAITAAPLGFSATVQVFMPDSMGFDSYFDIRDNMTYTEQLISFAVGLAPRATHLRYMKLDFVSLKERRGPSLSIACNLCSALAATEAVNVILRRRPVRPAPHYYQFDPFRQVYRKGYMPAGNRNPIQRLKRWLLTRKLSSLGIGFDDKG